LKQAQPQAVDRLMELAEVKTATAYHALASEGPYAEYLRLDKGHLVYVPPEDEGGE
jgi:hypothetical protein